jgi:hypothetical protein
MKKRYLWLPLVLFIAFSAQSANAVLMHFEDLTLGTSYGEPNSFFASGIEIQVGEFYPYSGGTTSGGSVTVQSEGDAGWFGNELWIDNVNLHFLLSDSGCTSCGVTLMFGYYGGDVNLGVNGESKEYQSIFDIPTGENIGGASIKVVGNGSLGAMMIINGTIDMFSIGGQELAIDSVLACEVPEPTTIALLGLGGFSLLMKRKKS